MLSRAELQAATFVGLLWTAIDITGGPRRPNQHWHFPGAYEAWWLAALPLPISSRCSCPQVYDNISVDSGDTWYSLATRQLTRLSKSDPHVACSISKTYSGYQDLN